jgi:hypothetical protein
MMRVHVQDATLTGFLDRIGRGDVRMIEPGERLRLGSNRTRRSGSEATASGRILIATSRPSVVSIARYTCPHSALADRRSDVVDTEARAGSQGQWRPEYRGRTGAEDGTRAVSMKPKAEEVRLRASCYGETDFAECLERSPA